MVNGELVGYIKQQLDKERTSEEIREDLKKGGGWSDSDVNEAFNTLYGKKEKKINSKTAMLIGAFFLVGLLGFLLGRASVSEKQLFEEQVQQQQEEIVEDDEKDDNATKDEISGDGQESTIEANAFIITLPKKYNSFPKSDEFNDLAEKYGNQLVDGCTIDSEKYSLSSITCIRKTDKERIVFSLSLIDEMDSSFSRNKDGDRMYLETLETSLKSPNSESEYGEFLGFSSLILSTESSDTVNKAIYFIREEKAYVVTFIADPKTFSYLWSDIEKSMKDVVFKD